MNNRTRRIVILALLIALGSVLMYLEVPLLPGAPWMKLDFSFLAILLAALLYGIWPALLVTVVVSFGHFLADPGPGGLPIGELANTIAVFSYLLVFTYWQKRGKIVVGCVSATLFVTVIMLLANYFWITPWFFAILGVSLPDSFFVYCVEVIGLFNLLRWCIISVVNYVFNRWLTDLVTRFRVPVTENDG